MTKHLLATSLVILFPLISSAQIPTDNNPQGNGTCLSLQHNMGYRTTDASTSGDVSALQDFLNAKGYLSVTPTGFYGILTTAAVKQFQTANGVSDTGYTGPFTRGKIAELTCGSSSTTSAPSGGVPPTTTGGPIIIPVGSPYSGTYQSYTDLVNAILIAAGSRVIVGGGGGGGGSGGGTSLCANYTNVINMDVPWGGTKDTQSNATPFVANGILVARFTVPAGASYRPGAVGAVTVSEFGDPSVYRQASLSKEACDFRGVATGQYDQYARDVTGQQAYPLQWGVGNTATTEFIVTGSARFLPQLQPGQTYYFNVRNWSVYANGGRGGPSCNTSTCNVIVHVSTP